MSRHQHKNTIQALSWSPNGNLVASASRDQTVRVFDIRAMKEFRVLKGHKKEVCCTIYCSLDSLHNLITFSSSLQLSPGIPYTLFWFQEVQKERYCIGIYRLRIALLLHKLCLLLALLYLKHTILMYGHWHIIPLDIS